MTAFLEQPIPATVVTDCDDLAPTLLPGTDHDVLAGFLDPAARDRIAFMPSIR